MAVSSLVAASSGPTLAEIQTAVSTYSKGPMDITWTQIGYTQPSGLTSVTFSSLGSYKYIKLLSVFFGSNTDATDLRLRINGDSTASMYMNSAKQFYGNVAGLAVRTFGPNTGFNLGAYGPGSGINHLEVEFINPTQTNGKKLIKFNLTGYDGSITRNNEGHGIYNSNSAVTSITLSSTNGYSFMDNGSPTGFYIYGAN